MAVWVAQAPAAPGQVGTGPTDLSLATQVLSGPSEFDLPGGAGALFDRAYWWFLDAAEQSQSEQERADNYLGAFRALNNLGVYCMTKRDDADAAQQAYTALLEAERIANSKLPGAVKARGGVLFNLGNLMELVGRHDEAMDYRQRARAHGVG